MTIRFKNNTIEFESGTNQWVLAETPVGLNFFGTISATQFNAFQNIGMVAGYTSGGSPTSNVIDTFPFSNNANAVDVGDLTVARDYLAGTSSNTHGYSAGGYLVPTIQNVIDRFGFGTTANASDVGDLSVARTEASAQTSSTHGYTSGGYFQQTVPLRNVSNVIDRFPFAATGNASDVGDLTVARRYLTGQSSSTTGYASGGLIVGSYLNTIDSFPFATTTGNAADVGDLSQARGFSAGQNSFTHGYHSGGTTGTGQTRIDRFPFATNANASVVGNLSVARNGATGQNSNSWGYTSGGTSSGNTVDRFPFASDGTASDVGDLTVARAGSAGQQY